MLACYSALPCLDVEADSATQSSCRGTTLAADDEQQEGQLGKRKARTPATSVGVLLLL